MFTHLMFIVVFPTFFLSGCQISEQYWNSKHKRFQHSQSTLELECLIYNAKTERFVEKTTWTKSFDIRNRNVTEIEGHQACDCDIRFEGQYANGMQNMWVDASWRIRVDSDKTIVFKKMKLVGGDLHFDMGGIQEQDVKIMNLYAPESTLFVHGMIYKSLDHKFQGVQNDVKLKIESGGVFSFWDKYEHPDDMPGLTLGESFNYELQSDKMEK